MTAGLVLDARRVWRASWLAWAVRGAVSPIPPWHTSRLEDEWQAIRAMATDARLLGVWSIDLSRETQVSTLGDGWGELKPGSECRPLRGASARLDFETPQWDAAFLRLELTPAGEIEATLDGGPPAWVAAGSAVALGPLASGAHGLALRTRAGEAACLQAVSVSRSPDPVAPQDAGYAGFVRPGLYDVPALIVAGSPEPPVEYEALPLAGDRAALVRRELRAGVWGTAAEALHGWTTALLVTLFPGVLLRSSLGAGLAFTTLALVTSFAGLSVVGITPTATILALALALPGVALAVRRKAAEPWRLPWHAVLPATATLLILTWSATRMVPPLEDQDVEVQAPAHALATRLVPATPTNRGSLFFFAHPPLLHVWVAAAITLDGRLPRVADADRLAREAWARHPVQDPARAEGWPYLEEWQALLGRFFREPQLWATRQVNVMLAALAVGVLAELLAGIAGATGLAAALALVLASFPEFLVRGAYGGYFASVTLLSLLVLSALRDSTTRGTAWPAALAALCDQKGLVVPLGATLTAARYSGIARWRPLIAACAALVLFAAWGLWIAPQHFLYDFVREHVWLRLQPGNLRLDADAAAWYPSAPELWREFVSRHGLVFTLLAGAASVLGLRSRDASVRAAAAAVALGALVFSLTDWRQTKHLAQLLAPALVAVGGLVEGRPGYRRALLALALWMIASNLSTAWPLLARFDALRPSTIW